MNVFGLAEELPRILGGGDGDDNGGASDANEEHHFEQTHGEENDRHGKKCTADGPSGAEALPYAQRRRGDMPLHRAKISGW